MSDKDKKYVKKNVKGHTRSSNAFVNVPWDDPIINVNEAPVVMPPMALPEQPDWRNATGSQKLSPKWKFGDEYGIKPDKTLKDFGFTEPNNITSNRTRAQRGVPVKLSATPQAPGKKTAAQKSSTPDVKVSTPAIEMNRVDFNKTFTADDIGNNEFADLVIQEIGGRELLILERHDLVDGINQQYSPIKNLSKFALEYSSTNINQNPNNAVDVFDKFVFEINDYIPDQSEIAGFSNEPSLAYFDTISKGIVINLKNLLDNQLVEVEFISFEKEISFEVL